MRAVRNYSCEHNIYLPRYLLEVGTSRLPSVFPVHLHLQSHYYTPSGGHLTVTQASPSVGDAIALVAMWSSSSRASSFTASLTSSHVMGHATKEVAINHQGYA